MVVSRRLSLPERYTTARYLCDVDRPRLRRRMEKAHPAAAPDRLAGLAAGGRDGLRGDGQAAAVNVRVARQRLWGVRNVRADRLTAAVDIRKTRQRLRGIRGAGGRGLILVAVHILHLPF